MHQPRVSSRRSRTQIEDLVLGVLERSRRPLSAYDIAQVLTATGECMVPNQVYRTLGRLIDRKVVHRVEMLSAYILCDRKFDACIICDHCSGVVLLKTPAEAAALVELARARGFRAHRIMVEMTGRCASCAVQDAARPKAPLQ